MSEVTHSTSNDALPPPDSEHKQTLLPLKKEEEAEVQKSLLKLKRRQFYIRYQGYYLAPWGASLAKECKDGLEEDDSKHLTIPAFIQEAQWRDLAKALYNDSTEVQKVIPLDSEFYEEAVKLTAAITFLREKFFDSVSRYKDEPRYWTVNNTAKEYQANLSGEKKGKILETLKKESRRKAAKVWFARRKTDWRKEKRNDDVK